MKNHVVEHNEVCFQVWCPCGSWRPWLQPDGLWRKKERTGRSPRYVHELTRN